MKKIIYLATLLITSFGYSQNVFPANGPVGIGTSTPNNTMALDVNGKAFIRSSFYVNDIRGGDGGNLTIGPNTGGPSSTIFMIGGVNAYEVMRVHYNGNVGIGTSTPSDPLTIQTNSTANALSLINRTSSDDYSNILFKNVAGTAFAGFGNSSGRIRIMTGGVGDAFERFTVLANGYVGIGTINPTSKLTVAGNINSREVKVTVDAGADFVFEKDYNLPTLVSLDTYIKEKKHLPEIASAKEMQKDGINLSEMNIKLLQKIEELTLYMIEQNKRLEVQQKENNIQTKEIEKLKRENDSFKTLSERFSKIENQLKKQN